MKSFLNVTRTYLLCLEEYLKKKEEEFNANSIHRTYGH